MEHHALHPRRGDSRGPGRVRTGVDEAEESDLGRQGQCAGSFAALARDRDRGCHAVSRCNARAPVRRRLCHAPDEHAAQLRRGPDGKSLRRHPVRRSGSHHRLTRHVAVGHDRRAGESVRACSWFSAGHCRKRTRQSSGRDPDRGHAAAAFRQARAGRTGRRDLRSQGAGAGVSHCRSGRVASPRRWSSPHRRWASMFIRRSTRSSTAGRRCTRYRCWPHGGGAFGTRQFERCGVNRDVSSKNIIRKSLGVAPGGRAGQ